MSDVKAVRQSLKLGLRAAAKELGISPSYLSDIERGNRDMSLEVANRMNKVYGYLPHVHRWQCECGATHV